MAVTNGIPLTPLQIETAIRMYGSGMGCAAIGRELGRNTSTIYSLLSRMQIIGSPRRTRPRKPPKPVEPPRDRLAERLRKLRVPEGVAPPQEGSGRAVRINPETQIGYGSSWMGGNFAVSGIK